MATWPWMRSRNCRRWGNPDAGFEVCPVDQPEGWSFLSFIEGRRPELPGPCFGLCRQHVPTSPSTRLG